MGRRLRLLPLLLAMSLLCGCGIRWSDSYQTIKPHEDGYMGTAQVNTVTASSHYSVLTALRNAVNDHRPDANLDVSQYVGDLEQELPDLILELKKEPIPSFAVRNITYELVEIGARRMAIVQIDYRRTQEEVAEIRTLWGIPALEREICNALDEAVPTMTILMHGYSAVNMNEVASKYYEEHLDSIMECPSIGAEIYPGTGSVRILELKFHYDHTQQELLDMRRETQSMLSSAAGYVRGQADERTKAERLYALLRPLISEEVTTSTPIYSLLCLGEGDSSSVATVFHILCSQASLNCLVVDGTLNEEPHSWNMLEIDGRYYHLDIMESLDSWSLDLHYDDDEMGRYEWDYDAYPEAPRPAPEPPPSEPELTEPASEPEPTEETEPAAPTEPEEIEQTVE